MSSKFLSTPWGSEVDAAVPVTLGHQTQWRWVYRLQLPPISQGDLLTVTSHFQITNSAGYNVEFVPQVCISPGWLYYHDELGYGPGIDSGTYPLHPLKGENRDPGQHYYATPHMHMWRSPVDWPNGAWLHTRIRTRSTAATGCEWCIINNGYGYMAVKIESGVE